MFIHCFKKPLENKIMVSGFCEKVNSLLLFPNLVTFTYQIVPCPHPHDCEMFEPLAIQLQNSQARNAVNIEITE